VPRVASIQVDPFSEIRVKRSNTRTASNRLFTQIK